MTASAADLAVVVGTHNRRDQLQQLLESIEQQTRTPYEIHVCDAGSTDGTIELLTERAARDARIRPVFEGMRRGQAAALNEVFRRLTTRWTCWLSDDNIVVERGLDVAAAALAADPRFGMVGLKVRDLSGPFAAAPYIGGITGIGVLNVNQGMLPTAVLQALDGFNESFDDYGIDADLTTRVLLNGWAVAMTRAVCILHSRNWAAPDTAEGARLAERNALYKALYMQTYGSLLRPSAVWLLRRLAWKALRLAFGGKLDLDTVQPVGSRPVRDWHNMIAGRFISLRYELSHPESPIHLVQRCSPELVRRLRPMLAESI